MHTHHTASRPAVKLTGRARLYAGLQLLGWVGILGLGFLIPPGRRLLGLGLLIAWPVALLVTGAMVSTLPIGGPVRTIGDALGAIIWFGVPITVAIWTRRINA